MFRKRQIIKKSFLFILMGLAFGCFKKEKKNDPQAYLKDFDKRYNLLFLGEQNLDGDLLSDAEEIKRGEDPLIAQVPTLLLQDNAPLRATFSIKNQGPGHLRISSEANMINVQTMNLTRLAHVKMAHQKFFHGINLTSPWSGRSWGPQWRENVLERALWQIKRREEEKATLLPESGEIDFNFGLMEQGTLPIQHIKGLRFGIHFLEKDASGQINFGNIVTKEGEWSKDLVMESIGSGRRARPFGSISLTKLQPELIKNLIKGQITMAVTIDNFFFQTHEDGPILERQDLLEKVKKKSSHFVISTPLETKEIYVASHLSFHEALLHLDPYMESEHDQKLSRFMDISSNLQSPQEWTNFVTNANSYGTWVVMGINDFSQKLVPGRTYYLVFLTVKDIMGLEDIEYPFLLDKKVEQKIQAGPVKPGDLVELAISGEKHDYSLRERVINIRDWDYCFRRGEEYPCKYGTCHAWYLDAVPVKSPLLFTNNLTPIRLGLKLGNKTLTLSSPELGSQGPRVNLRPGQIQPSVLLQFNISQDLVSNEEILQLYSLPDPSPTQVKVGFQRHNCRPNHDTTIDTHSRDLTLEKKQVFNVSMKVKGKWRNWSK